MTEKKIYMLGEPLKERNANPNPTSGGDAINFTMGGARLNTHVAYALGSEEQVGLHLMGTFGDTPRCVNILKPVVEAGVGIDHLIRVPGGQAGEYRIETFLDENGKSERRFHYKDRDDAAFREWFTPRYDIHRAKTLAVMDTNSTLVLSGITISRARTQEDYERLYDFVQQAQAQGAHIVVDPNVRMALWAEHRLETEWRGEQFVAGNQATACQRIGKIMALAERVYISYPDDTAPFFGSMTPDTFAPLLFSDSGLKQLVVKQGPEGNILYTQSPDGTLKKHLMKAADIGAAIDTSGAGDTFMAGTEVALAHGAGIRQALGVGSRAAGNIVEQSGAVLSAYNTPDMATLQAAMRSAVLGEPAPKAAEIGRR